MQALTWHGKGDIRCESVADPKIEDDRDAIIKVTACAICGSDLFDGVIPTKAATCSAKKQGRSSRELPVFRRLPGQSSGHNNLQVFELLPPFHR